MFPNFASRRAGLLTLNPILFPPHHTPPTPPLPPPLFNKCQQPKYGNTPPSFPSVSMESLLVLYCTLSVCRLSVWMATTRAFPADYQSDYSNARMYSSLVHRTAYSLQPTAYSLQPTGLGVTSVCTVHVERWSVRLEHNEKCTLLEQKCPPTEMYSTRPVKTVRACTLVASWMTLFPFQVDRVLLGPIKSPWTLESLRHLRLDSLHEHTSSRRFGRLHIFCSARHLQPMRLLRVRPESHVPTICIGS